MKSFLSVAAAFAAAASVALGTGAASAASASGPPVRTYIPTPAKSQLVYRPSKVVLVYGPELVARDIHWQYWHHGRARGTARLYGCDVKCSSLGRHVTLYFHDARYLRMNASEFVKLHITHAHNINAYWRWDARYDSWE